MHKLFFARMFFWERDNVAFRASILRLLLVLRSKEQNHFSNSQALQQSRTFDYRSPESFDRRFS